MFQLLLLNPATLAAAAGFLGLLGIGSLAYAYKSKGKNIAILGERAVGKTNLRKFLTEGSLPKIAKQTIGTEKTSSNRLKIKDLELKINEGKDVSGSTDARGEWKEIYNEADIVIYLLRADKIASKDKTTEDRVVRDIEHITPWRKEQKNPPKFFIIGTYCDKIFDFNKSKTGNNTGSYYDYFKNLPVIKNIILQAGGHQNVTVILGSTATETSTEEVVYQLLKEAAQ